MSDHYLVDVGVFISRTVRLIVYGHILVQVEKQSHIWPRNNISSVLVGDIEQSREYE